jgi:plastocyanin
MKIKDILNKIRKTEKTEQAESSNTEDTAVESENTDEEVTRGTKVKVIAALLVVGFAAYVAWWVQEPVQIRADVLAGNSSTEETASNVAASEPATPESTMQTQASGTVEVAIKDFAFSPAEISVAKGTTVIWTNSDAIPHTVTGPDFSSGTLNSGETFSYTFDQDATVEYTCSFHPQEKGKIIVGTGISSETQETQAALAAETLAPTEELMPAAPTATEEALSTGLDQEIGATPTLISAISEEQPASAATQETVHASADKKLASSGPEDIFYLFGFAGILYLNRKKLLAALR